jgi:arylsulfatase A-like enzyme
MYANHYPMPLDQEFLAEILRRNGYQTAYIGKWHLDGGVKFGFVPPGERRLGFDTFIGFNRGHAYYDSIYWRDTDQPFTSKRYEPDFQTDHLIEFMDEARRDEHGRPFFAEICFGIPHPPLVGPEHYMSLYSADEIELPENVPQRADIPDKRRQALARYHGMDESSDLDFRDLARGFLARYYGLVACVDFNVGRILNWLDANGLAEDTMVLLMSDHGELAGEHGRFEKKTYYQNAMNSALLARYPARFQSGRVINALVDPSVDTMPTLLELCGIDIPDQVQGISYLPLLDARTDRVREAVYYEVLPEREGPERHPTSERGVRTERWLYVRTREAPLALFDLENDPLETNNIIGCPQEDEYDELIETLDRQLSAHMEETGDDWDIEASFPPPHFQTHAEGDLYRKELLKRAIVEP